MKPGHHRWQDWLYRFRWLNQKGFGSPRKRMLH